MIDITVCIPAYNAADVIENAIESITRQDVNATVEILVYDDGSTDATPLVLAGLSQTVDGLRILTGDKNRGRPFARNRLLEAARGRFVTWLDADDSKYPGMLKAQYEYLQTVERTGGEAALRGLLVFTNYDWWWQESDEPKLMQPEPPVDALEDLLSARFGGYLWLMMGLADTFRTAGPFDERLPRLQDLGFFIRFAELGGRFERVETDAPLCVYNKHDGGRNAIDVWRSWNRLWRHNRRHFKSYGMDNARRWRRHHYRVSRRFARANGDRFAYWWIAGWELFFIVRGRFRRVIFDV